MDALNTLKAREMDLESKVLLLYHGHPVDGETLASARESLELVRDIIRGMGDG